MKIGQLSYLDRQKQNKTWHLFISVKITTLRMNSVTANKQEVRKCMKTTIILIVIEN